MAYVGVELDGTEVIGALLERNVKHGFWDEGTWGITYDLPKGTIKKLIGRDLTWEDEPVKLK